MNNTRQHEGAIQHENAAKAHRVADKQSESSARAGDRDGLAARLLVPDTSSAWYHAEALKEAARRTQPKA